MRWFMPLPGSAHTSSARTTSSSPSGSKNRMLPVTTSHSISACSVSSAKSSGEGCINTVYLTPSTTTKPARPAIRPGMPSTTAAGCPPISAPATSRPMPGTVTSTHICAYSCEVLTYTAGPVMSICMVTSTGSIEVGSSGGPISATWCSNIEKFVLTSNSDGYRKQYPACSSTYCSWPSPGRGQSSTLLAGGSVAAGSSPGSAAGGCVGCSAVGCPPGSVVGPVVGCSPPPGVGSSVGASTAPGRLQAASASTSTSSPVVIT